MAPFVVLTGSFLLFRILGFAGVPYFGEWQHALQAAVAAMLLLTASAHWGKRRADLIGMVPRSLPNAAGIVTVTGLLEIAGAAAILVPAYSHAAAVGIAVFFVLIFPANVRGAREKLTIGGRPVPGLIARTVLQVAFIAAALLASPLIF